MNWLYDKYTTYSLLAAVKKGDLQITKYIIENKKYELDELRRSIYNVIDQHQNLNLQLDYKPIITIDHYWDSSIDHSIKEPNIQDYNMLKVLLSDKSAKLNGTMLPAVYRGDLQIIDLLLKDGRFNPNVSFVYSPTRPLYPIDLAKYYNRKDIEERLLQDPRLAKY